MLSGPELSARAASATKSTQLQQGTSSQSLNATEAKRRTEHNKKHLKRALSTIEKDSLRYRSSFLKPWLDEGGKVIWSAARIQVAKTVLSQTFETVMGIIITFNVALMILETNADASCYPEYMDNLDACPTQSSSMLWLQIVNVLLLVIYSIECAARAFVERGLYFFNRWNQIDLLTVFLGWLGTMLSSAVNLNVLRIMRLVRLMRAARVVISIPEFYILVSGLTSSFKAILFGSVMLICIIVVWAIIVVEILNPLNVTISYPTCERCSSGFGSVAAAVLTIFQQVVAGDSWGSISIPLAEAYPWTTPILFFIMITISLGAMNLILAVIVERATEARENDQVRKIQKKDAEREKHMVELALLCDSMDFDGSGTLSLEEMLNGYDSNPQFDTLMELMDITRDDMETIFKVLDVDKSGEVDYVEFCQHLGNFRKRDAAMMPSLIKYSVMEIRQMIKRDVMQILEEHTDMLQDQLDVLASMPACMAKAEEIRVRRRSAPSLRRQGKSEGKPQFFGVGAAGASLEATSYGPGRVGVDVPEDPGRMLDSLQETCTNFQSMQTELESMMAHAEHLTVTTLDRALQKVVRWEDEAQEEAATEAESDANSSDMAELEAKCACVLASLKERVHEEERLQQKCRSIISNLGTLMDEGSGLFVVKQVRV